jgi:hypothetical protein
MDEKEAIRRIRNSLRVGRSDAQIISSFHKRGYRVAYASELLRKARRPRKLFLLSFFVLLLFVSLFWGGYMFSLNESLESTIDSLLASLSVKGSDSSVSSKSSSGGSSVPRKVTLSRGFITTILSDLDAQDYLHRNVVFDKPKINFLLGSKSFNAVISGDDIVASTGLLDDADIQFTADQETVDEAFNASDPYGAVGSAISSGDVEIEKLVSDAELFSKGYASWYDSLSG